MLLSASYLIVTHSSASDGQFSQVSVYLHKYVEEAAGPSSLVNRLSATALSSFSQFVSAEEMPNSLDNYIGTTQDSALLPYNAADNNLAILNPEAKSNQIVTYTVQEGDNLSFIASDYGVDVSTIIWANKLKDVDAIAPGDELKIPPVDGVIHKVKKGDTLNSIATKYQAVPEKILAFNALPKDGSLQIDDEIVVPDGKLRNDSGNIVPKIYAADLTVKRFSQLPDLADYFMLPSTGYDWGIIHGRNGVDIANSCGTPIYAAADGKVVIATEIGWNGGFGKYIKLTHSNGTETVYGHLSKVLVSEGTAISKGAKIALMGTTGNSTGCHLHFEVHGAKNPLAKY